ncbi:oligosaccharide flippase family protein [Niveispirillum fermenti]|uniref:oligosaccharide flippase family protein n=1 Tax=Niveispirillum fermenti TaxID=1233113 RepID=UPI003A8BF020
MIDGRILRNISYMGMANVANILIPLLVLPFLTRALEPAAFGHYAWAVSTGTLLGLICDFGFNWTGVREVAIHRDDRRATAAIVLECYTIRALMMAGATMLILLAWLFLPHGGGVTAMLPYVPLVAAANLLTPAWMFQGLERFGTFVFSALLGRVLSVLAVVLLVRHPDDLHLAVLLTASGGLLPGLVSMRFIAGHFAGVLRRPTSAQVVARFRACWQVFTTDLVIQLYTAAQTFLVGLFGGPAVTAQFNIADRCLNAGKMFLSAITQAAMPRVAHLARNDRRAGLRLIGRIMLLCGAVGSVGSLIMLFGADWLVALVFGPAYAEAALVLRILSPVPILIGIGSCFSSLYMFNFGEGHLWGRMLKAAAGISLALFLGLVLLAGVQAHIAAALAILAAESFVFCVSGYRFALALRRG